MGTDIHFVAQKKCGDAWEDIETSWVGNRHYRLFAHLAGVRNGSGFAGCRTGDEVVPIQGFRGLPDDFDVNSALCHPTESGHVWMGDHSFGWVSSEELVAHNWNQGRQCGIVSVDQFRAMRLGDVPSSHFGGVWGPDVVVAEDPTAIDQHTTHVRVWWQSSQHEFDYFLSEILRLREAHGEFRIVFGFDS